MNKDFEYIHQFAQNIEGWFGENEAKTIFKLASNLNNQGCIVEIGSWCGKSLSYISYGALKNGFNNKIYSIDPFLTSKNEYNGKFETFQDNLKKLNLLDKITHIREKSQIVGESFNENIELLFIDGFHQYDFVKKDFELFYPLIIENGYFILHDVCCYEGPTRLIEEIIQTRTDLKILAFENLSIFTQKVKNLSPQEIESNKEFLNLIKTQRPFGALVL